MRGEPWWMERVAACLSPVELGGLRLGELWRLSERLRFIPENVDTRLLPADFEAFPQARSLWAALLLRESAVREALAHAGAEVSGRVRAGQLGPVAFRSTWEGLGFAANDGDAGTAADDWLDGLFRIARHTLGGAQAVEGSPNMASRAHRAADFLSVTEPGAADVVVDLGSGSGKLALTVSASTFTQVVGVEYGGVYVEAARQSAAALALGNVRFEHADVRDVDLSQGSIFYLYYPFRGEVARATAAVLGRLAREKDITVYSSGPLGSYGEHFLEQVELGALVLSERRGEFEDILVLRSARA